MANTLPATAQAAGVKTPGSGAFSDPAQVGAMIQSMYPQYRNIDPTTLGQRWIAVHTPQAGTGAGATTDLLQAPTANQQILGANTTQSNQQYNTPDLSGLNKFATPIQQPKKQPKPVSLTSGLNALSSSMGGVNTMGQAATPYTVPVQYQQPKPKPKPQQPLGLSTFDISKVRF